MRNSRAADVGPALLDVHEVRIGQQARIDVGRIDAHHQQPLRKQRLAGSARSAADFRAPLARLIGNCDHASASSIFR